MYGVLVGFSLIYDKKAFCFYLIVDLFIRLFDVNEQRFKVTKNEVIRFSKYGFLASLRLRSVTNEGMTK
ncbi:MAG: hypothetical protein Tsb0033_03050 [Winogradskyella sp.]